MRALVPILVGVAGAMAVACAGPATKGPSEPVFVAYGPLDPDDPVAWAHTRGWRLARSTPEGLTPALRQAESHLWAVEKATGRVRTWDKTLGTGFVVAPEWIATAKHVAKNLDANTWVELGETTLRVVGPPLLHPDDDDVALLRVARKADVEPLALGAASDGKERLVVAIGYPAMPPQSPREQRWFPGAWDHEWMSAGTATPLPKAGLFPHDCPAMRGYSGAPIVDLASGEVIGVHVAWDKDEGHGKAVPARAIAELLAERGVD